MLSSSLAGIIWPLVLMVRKAASQAANAEFKSRRGHCGYRIMASSAGCGPAHEGSIPSGHIRVGCLEVEGGGL